MSQPEDNEIHIDVDESGDFRISTVGVQPQDVQKLVSATFSEIQKMNREQERARIRRFFFNGAHVFVFVLAGLCVLGFVADFLNYRDFNTFALFLMGGWFVGTLCWLYFVIIKDSFGFKDEIPRPPSLSDQEE